MRKTFAFLMTFLVLCNVIISEEQEEQSSFQSYTGRVLKNRVRMRLQPTLDSPIIQELEEGELMVVVGETEEFLAVIPPKGTKAFISRRFVLDGVVEGDHVNVRLDSTLESPVIAQLNTGDRIEGDVSSLNSKWLEINVPESVLFYVSNDYLEKVGDPSYLASQDARRDEVNRLLSSTYMVSQAELQKPFNEIDLEPVFAKFAKIIKSYSDFPDQVGRARELMTQTQDKYLQKKVAYLEARARNEGEGGPMSQEELTQEIEEQQARIQTLENQIEQASSDAPAYSYEEWAWENNPSGVEDRIIAWIPVEKELYEEWLIDHEGASFEAFYQDEEERSVLLSGILQLYNQSIRNKPGDYVLLHRVTKLPIAYLYTTRFNLESSVGRDVTLRASVRPNHNFAYPAYFVLSLEDS